MKRNIITAFSLAIVLVSCQKNVETPIASSNTVNSSSISNIQINIPLVTFAKPSAYNKITSAKVDAIFSDSVYVSKKQAFLHGLKFDVKGTNLNFSHCSLLIDGEKQLAKGSFENNVLTIVLNKAKSLPVGNHSIQVIAKVNGAAQTFSVGLQQTNAVITNRANVMATMNGLPVYYSIVLNQVK